MKNIKELYKSEFDQIEDDNNLYENTLHYIEGKYSKRRKLEKIYLSICSVFIITLVGVSIVYAQEITETLKSFYLKNEIRINEDGDKFNVSNIINEEHIEINQNIDLKSPECSNKRGYKGPDINDSCFGFYSKDELEKMLNIKLIKSKLNKKSKVVLWDAKNNNDKYTSLTFRSYDIYNTFEEEDTKVPKVVEDIFISTNYDTRDGIIQSFADKEMVKEIYIDSLNTNGFIVEGEKSRKIFFVVNKIAYVFTINSRGRSVDDLDEEVNKLIHSFEY